MIHFKGIGYTSCLMAIYPIKYLVIIMKWVVLRAVSSCCRRVRVPTQQFTPTGTGCENHRACVGGFQALPHLSLSESIRDHPLVGQMVKSCNWPHTPGSFGSDDCHTGSDNRAPELDVSKSNVYPRGRRTWIGEEYCALG